MTPEEEKELRQLRDNIYGPQTDRNWESCRENWAKMKQWLIDNQPTVAQAQ
jgi:hypothetical protein